MEVLKQETRGLTKTNIENRPPSSKPGSSLPPISNKSVAELIRQKRRIDSAASKSGYPASSLRSSGRILAGLAKDESSRGLLKSRERQSSAASSRMAGFGDGDLFFQPESVTNLAREVKRKKRAKEQAAMDEAKR